MSEESEIIFSPDLPPHKCFIKNKYFTDPVGTIRQCSCGKVWRYRVYYYANLRLFEWYELGPVGLWWHTRKKKKKKNA